MIWPVFLGAMELWCRYVRPANSISWSFWTETLRGPQGLPQTSEKSWTVCLGCLFVGDVKWCVLVFVRLWSPTKKASKDGMNLHIKNLKKNTELLCKDSNASGFWETSVTQRMPGKKSLFSDPLASEKNPSRSWLAVTKLLAKNKGAVHIFRRSYKNHWLDWWLLLMLFCLF